MGGLQLRLHWVQMNLREGDANPIWDIVTGKERKQMMARTHPHQDTFSTWTVIDVSEHNEGRRACQFLYGMMIELRRADQKGFDKPSAGLVLDPEGRASIIHMPES